MKTKRDRGFIDWNPQPKTVALLSKVKQILKEYSDNLPLSIRQVFYRLVAQHGYEKTEQSYNRLCEILNKARRARYIPMSAIRDDGFFLSSFESFASANEVLSCYQEHSQRVRMDRQEGQDRRLILWCEAQGMKPMLETVANRYSVPVASSGGFDSLTSKHNMAELFARGRTEVLHIGDFDPSGVHMFSSLTEDIQAFASCLGGHIQFTRLAVTPEQKDNFQLPTAPPKKTDRRSFDNNETVQCEALPPDTLLEIVEESICTRMDMNAYEQILLNEMELRAELENRLSQIF